LFCKVNKKAIVCGNWQRLLAANVDACSNNKSGLTDDDTKLDKMKNKLCTFAIENLKSTFELHKATCRADSSLWIGHHCPTAPEFFVDDTFLYPHFPKG